MDIGELLTYKPSAIPKRQGDDEEDEDEEPPKRIKMTDESERSDDILSKIWRDSSEEEPLNDLAVKKMILSFEKKVFKNQELRIKFPDMPQKWMEAEVELNDGIQELHAVATAPELYEVLVSLNVVPSLLGLLNHENSDISIAVISLLQELTDVDTLNESEEGASVLLTALLENQICAVLVGCLDRLDESVKEESDGVHNALAILENISELRPESMLEFAQQGLLPWLLKRVKAKLPFDGNKLYASEMLSIVLQTHPDNRISFGEADGIDMLLQQLAWYKRHDPSSVEEAEFMFNLFDCLCSSLTFAPNRLKFLKGEGLQLMNLMLREKKLSRNGALKLLNHAMSGPDGVDNCNKFVEILGLRTIFPLFMKTPTKHGNKGLAPHEHEEHVTSIIASMLKNCKANVRQRILNKFCENDHEKVDRLMELHFQYLDRIRDTDLIIDKERLDLLHSGEDPDEIEDGLYVKRLEGGLFTLQHLDYIMVEVCASGPPTIKQRVLHIINLRRGSIKTIRNVMREYAGNLGDAISEDNRSMEQQRILNLVDKF